MAYERSIAGIGRPAAVLLAGAVLTALSGVPALAERGTPPAEGSVFDFRCDMNEVGNFAQRYTIKRVKGDVIDVEVTDHRGTHHYTKPYFFGGTTLIESSMNDGREASMDGDMDEFAGLAAYETGWRGTGWISERRDDNAADLNWNYTVTVTGREQVFNEAVGSREVAIVEEDRWVNLYSSKMYSQVVPAIGFPILWQYSDSNGTQLRCELASLTKPGAPAVASAPANRPAPAPDGAGSEAARKLAVLDDLLARGLITKAEHAGKARSLGGAAQSPGDAILVELVDLNRNFRQKKLAADEFVRRRAELLTRVNDRDMSRDDALALARKMADQRLISQVEYTRKRLELTERK